MTKYEEVEKLQELKANGTITQAEFEIEKQKVLNAQANMNRTKRKKPKAKIFFILTSIFLIITIVFVGLYIHFDKAAGDAMWGGNGYYGLQKAELEHESREMSDEKYNKIKREQVSLYNLEQFFNISSYVIGGITIALLTTGIILKVKEKKKYKI